MSGPDPDVVRDAYRIRDLFAEVTGKAGPLDLSLNRHGQTSAYFDTIWPGVRVRVSDHETVRDDAVTISREIDMAGVRKWVFRYTRASDTGAGF